MRSSSSVPLIDGPQSADKTSQWEKYFSLEAFGPTYFMEKFFVVKVDLCHSGRGNVFPAV